MNYDYFKTMSDVDFEDMNSLDVEDDSNDLLVAIIKENENERLNERDIFTR